MTDREALADSVAGVRFPSTRLRRGYAAGDVDPFLTDLAAAVRAGLAIQARIDGARFKQSYGGYDMAAVDDFLDRTGAAAADSDAPAGPAADRPAADVVVDAPSAISRGEGGTGGPARVIPVVVTIGTYGVVAGITAVVLRNVRPGTSLPVWPVVAVGCAVGLVYELAARVVRARRR